MCERGEDNATNNGRKDKNHSWTQKYDACTTCGKDRADAAEPF